MLAVSKKGDEHTAMDVSDLLKCLKIGYVYHCPDISILSRSVDTCVSTIYFKDLEAVGSTCGPLFRLVDKRVMRVGTSDYLVNTPFPLTLNCNQTTTTLHVKSFDVVHVPPICTAYNAQIHILIQPKAPSIQAEDVNIEFSLPTRVLRGHAICSKLEVSNEAEEKAEAERMRKEEEEADSWDLGTRYNSLVGALVAVLSTLVAGGTAYWWCRCREGKASEQHSPETSVSGGLTAVKAVFWTQPKLEAEEEDSPNQLEHQPVAERHEPQVIARHQVGPPLIPKRERGSTDRGDLTGVGDNDVFYEDNMQTPAPLRRHY